VVSSESLVKGGAGLRQRQDSLDNGANQPIIDQVGDLDELGSIRFNDEKYSLDATSGSLFF